MKRFLLLLSFLPGDALLAAEFKFDAQTLTVPDGFVAELAAASPLVERPITADFDEQGQLYVSEASGTNDKVEKQLAEKPHRIVRLADTNGDGAFDQRIVFADHLMMPQGTMWWRGSLYVSAPPSIWKLTDTDNDGTADRREEWFAGKTLTGCANDLHGPYRGRDGWIYWCKGAFAEQTYDLPGRPGWKTRASHIFRARPDGTGLEPVLTGGMDNPVDLVFTPEGERVLSCTFFQHPAGGERDGLIHAIYGGVYGKDHEVLNGHPRTGALMPVLTHLGPAAASGLHAYESPAFGMDFGGNLFASLFNLRKVTRHRLTPQFTTEDSDFLVSDATDFHPTDVLEDADGSLLVVDTGGWYKLCCPTTQLVKPEAVGGIYRVRRKDAPAIADPRGLALDWTKATPAALAERLGDEPRPAVRERAIEALAALGDAALPALREPATSSDARRNAVWALSRIDSPKARDAVRAALADPSPSVRHAAIHVASVWRDKASVDALLPILRNDAPALQRAAAEALGRMGDERAVPLLLSALAAPKERTLEHSLSYALIELGFAEPTRRGLTSPAAGTQRAALLALEQMPGGYLQVGDVLPQLSAIDPALPETAAWIVGRHGEWGGELAGHLRAQLQSPEADRAGLVRTLAQLAGHPDITKLLSEAASGPQAALALEAITAAQLRPVPAVWMDALLAALQKPATRGPAIAAVRAQKFDPKQTAEMKAALLVVANDPGADAPLRFAALDATSGPLDALDRSTLALLARQLTPGTAPMPRLAAAQLVSRAKISEADCRQLLEHLPVLGPADLSAVLPVFEQMRDPDAWRDLFAILDRTPAFPAVPPARFRELLAKAPAAVQSGAGALLARLGASVAQQRARLDELAAALPGGDIRRGQAIFNSNKSACATCHALGYVGGRFGPDLTRIGQIRNERDLLEAIVFPSASFVRSFEPFTVLLRDGGEQAGLLRQEGADEIVLATGPQSEVRHARADIAELRPGALSPMPAGYDAIFTPAELADLVAFLKAAR